MDKICVHCFVSGRVQGVFYRAFVQDEARAQKITGWAKNLSDGRVEVVLCGEREKVHALQEKLRQGPARADVENVTREEIPWEDHEDFLVR